MKRQEQTTTGTPSSSSSSSSSSRLQIYNPIGNHGDVVLEMQVRYANDDALRRRIVEPHQTRRSTKKVVNELKEANVGSFLERAQQAASSGDSKSARIAIEELASVERNNSYFSVVGDYAELALLSLNRQITSRQQVGSELEKRILVRRCKAGLCCGIICLLIIYLDSDTDTDEGYPRVLSAAMITLFLILFVVSLLRREYDAKKLVDELYSIASIGTPYDDADNETDVDQVSLLHGRS